MADRGILVDSLLMVVDLYLGTGHHAQAGGLLEEAETVAAQAWGLGRHSLCAVLVAKLAWWLLARGDAPGALQRLATAGEAGRDEDRWTVGSIGAASALAAGQADAASRWLAGLDILVDVATDVLVTVLLQRLNLRPADEQARERALTLLAAGRVPALEAAKLRSALG